MFICSYEAGNKLALLLHDHCQIEYTFELCIMSELLCWVTDSLHSQHVYQVKLLVTLIHLLNLLWTFRSDDLFCLRGGCEALRQFGIFKV